MRNNDVRTKIELKQRRISRLARRDKLHKEKMRQKAVEEQMEKTQKQLEEEITVWG